MSSLNQLYHEVIVDHGRHPRNFGMLPDAKHLRGHNPLCGDELMLYLKIEQGMIVESRFDGQGCAISMASASLMTQAIKGKTLAEAEILFEHFHSFLINPHEDADADALLGKLVILKGVSEYPSRIKCATLAWHTLHALLKNEHEPVSTE
ncbi:MAG: SUF system NifU family Fe-S cluster assembly protein [Gammaproteobacteria bacterium]|jgi:nitrogen fixation NifU-like protein|nr:SUF system NifU family Fe-S cluster assembly protein [Gammaproteobacteria bacterium]